MALAHPAAEKDAAMNSSKTGAVVKDYSPLLQTTTDSPFVDSSVEDDFVSITVNYFNDKTAAAFADKVAKAQRSGQPVLPITVSSWGGYIHAFMAMKAALDRSEIPVLTYTPDRAMSCGFALLACGTAGYRFVDPNATTMDHQATYAVGGKDAEVANAQEYYRNRLDRFYNVLDKACGQQQGFFKQRWDDKNNLNNYLTADETVALGAADAVAQPVVKAEATVNWTIQR